MKTILIALLVSLTWSTADDLPKLKAIRQEMAAKAVAPINDNFKRELKRLLDDAMRSQKLDEAVKLRNELALFELAGTYHPKGNKAFVFVLTEFGVVYQVGGDQTGRWRVSGDKVNVKLGEWEYQLDTKMTGSQIWKGKNTTGETLVKE